jgi:hypothetical protein
LKLYIDESGNTGDITPATLANQPYFTLSGVAINDDLSLEYNSIVKTYREKRNLQSLEIKSANTYDSNHLFTRDVLNLVLESAAPFFSELSDKKYLLCASVVSTTIIPLWMKPKQMSTELLRHVSNKFADHIFYSMSNYHIQAYLDTSKFPTRQNFLKLIALFEADLINGSEDVNEGLRKAFYEIKKIAEDDETRIEDLLLSPDSLKSGKQNWMVPYIPSFSNIYGRVNKMMKEKNITDLEVYHDEQNQYEHIIREYKDLLESNEYSTATHDLNLEILFHFEKSHPIKFVSSSLSTEMQLSDILAGFINRATYQKLHGTLRPEYGAIFRRLLRHGRPPTGINFVVPERVLNDLIK